jgi:hypothetical protein
MPSDGYKNHHQIYTHCSLMGVCIGQEWTPKENTNRNVIPYRIMCITENGYVVLRDNRGWYRPHKVYIGTLIKEFQLTKRIYINPFEQTDKKTHLQVIALYDDNSPYVCGELRNDYDPT